MWKKFNIQPVTVFRILTAVCFDALLVNQTVCAVECCKDDVEENSKA